MIWAVKTLRHNPCLLQNGSTKSLQNGEAQPLHSLYKMALVHMDPSKNDSLYKMVGAKAIFQTPKINKMLDL